MDSGNFLMIMPIILTLQLIKKEFSGTIRNLEDGYASVQSAIPLQCFPVNFADFLAEVFGSDDDKVITLGQEFLLEVVCYFDFQSDTEFLSVVYRPPFGENDRMTSSTGRSLFE